MAAPIDRTGQRYNRLVALRRHKNQQWLWQCDCGKQHVAQAAKVVAGHVKSCGCLRREVSTERIAHVRPEYSDAAGKRFGALVAVEMSGRKDGKVVWRCRCDCGGERLVKYGHLSDGSIQSCGCGQVSAEYRLATRPRVKKNKRLASLFAPVQQLARTSGKVVNLLD